VAGQCKVPQKKLKKGLTFNTPYAALVMMSITSILVRFGWQNTYKI